MIAVLNVGTVSITIEILTMIVTVVKTEVLEIIVR